MPAVAVLCTLAVTDAGAVAGLPEVPAVPKVELPSVPKAPPLQPTPQLEVPKAPSRALRPCAARERARAVGAVTRAIAAVRLRGPGHRRARGPTGCRSVPAGTSGDRCQAARDHGERRRPGR